MDDNYSHLHELKGDILAIPKRKEITAPLVGTKENPYIFICSSATYPEYKELFTKYYSMHEDDLFLIPGGWMKLTICELNVPKGTVLTLSRNGAVIGRVNKPSRQEFMDAKYKHKNFAKDYLMKGKKW